MRYPEIGAEFAHKKEKAAMDWQPVSVYYVRFIAHEMRASFIPLKERLFLCQFLQTLAADVFAFKIDNIVCAVAEDASRLVFVENNLISIYKNFQGVFYINSQGTAQLNGQDNAAQFIYSSYNTC